MDLIKNAIVYPFKDKEWPKKYVVVAVILLSAFILMWVINLIVIFPLQLIGMAAQSSSPSMDSIKNIFSYFSSIGSYGVSILSLPIIFYFFGYFSKAIKTIMNKEEIIVPLHDDIWKKILNGALLYLLQVITGLPFIIVSVGVVISAGFGVYFLSSIPHESALYVALLILIIVLAVVILLALIIFAILFYTSSAYIFISTGDFGKSLNIKRLFGLIRNYWKEFFSIYGYVIVFKLLLIPAYFISVFTAFLGFPVVMASYYYAVSYTIGTYFKKIKEEEEK
jgi:hypothetical protein